MDNSKNCWEISNKINDMSDRLKYLSDDKEMRIQQLHLMINNCRVYKIKDEIKQEYVNELNRLENDSNL